MVLFLLRGEGIVSMTTHKLQTLSGPRTHPGGSSLEHFLYIDLVVLLAFLLQMAKHAALLRLLQTKRMIQLMTLFYLLKAVLVKVG